MLDEADDNIDQFLAITGTTNRDVAIQYLQMAGGNDNLEAAISIFLEVGDDQQVVADSNATDIGIDTANDDNTQEEEDDESNVLSEPDYDYLVEDDNENNTLFDTLCKEIIGEREEAEDDIQQQHADDDIDTSPDYYDNLGLDCAELSATAFDEFAPIEEKKQEEEDNMKAQCNEVDEQYNFYAEEVVDDGEEYILGTLMVRVLQAKHVKSNPNNQGGNMIANLLSSHRRNRHQQRPTMSPASAIASGNLTPYSNQQLYAKLTYNNQGQLTSNALEHMNGDYHWSRSDQSYFDVTCSAFPLRMGEKKMMHHQQPPRPLGKKQASSAPILTTQKDDVSCSGSKPNNNEFPQPILKREKKRQSPPILQLSLYSKNTHGSNHKQKGNSWPFQNEKDVEELNDDDYLIGKCSINIQRILSGKTPYFDEWIDIQSSDHNKNEDESSAGRVRIVIEYESTDPPPRPGDMCTFANTHLIEDELYPIPLYSIKKTIQPLIARSSMSMSTLPSASSSHKPPTKYTTKLARYPKTFRVEEVVGDIVILSYTTPVENWQCTFEVHRYLLLCVERHQAIVEKLSHQALDLFDNLSQSPALEQITKTVETLPDEGLVYVGAGVLGESVNLLGRWWETGVEGMVEDVVNGTNLDGRYSHLSDDEEEEESDEAISGVYNQLQEMTLDESDTSSRQALPGMPCCPITGLPMIEPVVCADGHTYERHAISRWLLSSNRSPLTGAILPHTELAPNYLLISSLGSESSVQEEENVILEEHPGLLDVL